MGRSAVARVVCGVMGVGLLVLGVLGLTQTGLSGFATVPEGTADTTDAFFGGSTLLNLIHIAFGLLALLAAWRAGARMAGLFGIIAFVGLLAYDVVALIADDPDDPLGARWPALLVHGLGLLASVAIVALDQSADAEERAHGSG